LRTNLFALTLNSAAVLLITVYFVNFQALFVFLSSDVQIPMFVIGADVSRVRKQRTSRTDIRRCSNYLACQFLCSYFLVQLQKKTFV